MATTQHGYAASRGADTPGEVTRLFRLVAILNKPLVRLLFRPRVVGVDRLPAGTGFVLSANQLSNLDGWALAYPLYPPRQLRWMGKSELFHPVVAPLLHALGIFPVKRGAGDLAAIATAAELARSGHVVAIFPEGTRRRKGLRKKHEARPHTGAARVALAAGVPLVPAAIRGTDRLTALRRWRVAFGEPVPVSDLENENPRQAAREATQRLWQGVTALEQELLDDELTESRTQRLHPRLRLDISTTDLLYGLVACALVRPRTASRLPGLPCLSVRSAFDLFLQSLDAVPGSEVVLSAITHPDMARVVEANGLVAVPVDLDRDTLAPRQELLERAITDRTCAVVVAHLFGGHVDLAPVAHICAAHGVPLVEDCAQSLAADGVQADPAADVSLFSFGTIKTATALGGGIALARDPLLLERMRSLQDDWPRQPRREHARKVAKLMALRTLSQPFVYGALARSFDRRGRDFDAFVNGRVRAFPGDLLPRIRRQPSTPLLALVRRRLAHLDGARLRARGARGEYVAERLPTAAFVPGGRALRRTTWLLPVVTPDPERLVTELRKRNLDASRATSSIAAVPAPGARPDLDPSTARELMERVVFVPAYPELPEEAVAAALDAVEAACVRP
jgi:perosamine synthetase